MVLFGHNYPTIFKWYIIFRLYHHDKLLRCRAKGEECINGWYGSSARFFVLFFNSLCPLFFQASRFGLFNSLLGAVDTPLKGLICGGLKG